MATTATQNIYAELIAAGIPIDGVGDAGQPPYPPAWHVVERADGFNVRIDYRPEATAPQITQGDLIARTTAVTPVQIRPVWAIYYDVIALTVTQQQLINNDLSANNWALIKTVLPPQDGPMLVMHWCVATFAAATGAEKRDASARMAAMFCQQNPRYLVNPPFDTSINVPGWEEVP